MRDLLARFREPDADCACDLAVEPDRLVLDATDCPGGGDLAAEPACRRTAVGALAGRHGAGPDGLLEPTELDAIVTRTDRLERAYEGMAAALLVAAGRFVERVAFYDEQLADRAARDPIGGARNAVGRAGPVADIVAETGLAEIALGVDGYADALRPFVGPPVAKARVAAEPPSGATLQDLYSLRTGGTVRIYEDDRPLRTYHLEPVEHGFDGETLGTLARAHDLLADGATAGGERAPDRAVRRVAAPDDPVEDLAAVLRKHTRGYGVLADFFADPAVSDVFATAPVGENPIRVTADGERFRTNVRLTATGARTLASRFRRASGRAFSRAAPTLDAAAEAAGVTFRVAGVTDPASDGPGFAFRAREETPWTLPGLVANGTLPADAAALLSVSVERAAAGLVAGPRGAGKTTLLGALCWELPADTRTVVIEDTPELPVGPLQHRGRDVQALRTATDDGPGLEPATALRTALRLGEGALVVGEVRGEEATVLYEAMRVGANDEAVLGTVHGDGGASVRERMASDLDVPASSFGTTDLVVTLEATEGPDGTNRRVRSVEEVVARDRFEPLHERRDGDLVPTGRVDRGDSVLLAGLADTSGGYAAVRGTLADRERLLADLAGDGRTDPAAVVDAYADRRQA